MSSPVIETVQVREEQRPRQYPGLIALVSAETRKDKSGKPQAAEVAIAYHLGRIPDVLPPAPPPTAEGIPPDLYRRLTAALLPTGCFDSARALNNYFVDERISPWAYRLPEAASPQERMMATLNFLHRQFSANPNYIGGESNVLVLFLHILSENMPVADRRHGELFELAQALTASSAPAAAIGSPLRHCWLIGSHGGSLPQADAIQAQYAGSGLTIAVRPVYDAFGVQETYDLVRRIYEIEIGKAGLRRQDVIADFTGGTKPMSTGMLLACAQLEAPLQYMSGQREGKPSEPRLITFAPAAQVALPFGV